MKLIEKLKNKNNDMMNYAPVTIAFLGDSVTQGCFEAEVEDETRIVTVFDPENSYACGVRKILSYLFPMAQINIINAGISGGTTTTALSRIDRDVLHFCPDMTVVCLGTNDCIGGEKGLKTYLDELREIFLKIRNYGSEIVFMTPHSINDHVSPKLHAPVLRKLALNLAEKYNQGIPDMYFNSAKELCAEMDIAVCDCYSLWKKMREGGVNTTELLSNRLNHPSREMHKLFAYELVKQFFES